MLQNTEVINNVKKKRNRNKNVISPLSILISSQRKMLGISSRKFAFKLGLGENVVYAIERGTNLPTIPVLLKIAKGLDIDSNTLFQMCRKERIRIYVEKHAKMFEAYKKGNSIQTNNIVFRNDVVIGKIPSSLINERVQKHHRKHQALFGEVTTPETGKIIKNKRISKGLLQRDLDKKIGKPYKYMSALECGEIIPSLRELSIIAKELSMDLLYLFNNYVSEKSAQYDKAYYNEYCYHKYGKMPPLILERKSQLERRFVPLHQKYFTLTSDIIIFLRKQMGLGRSKLQKKLGISPAEIEKYENGICLLSFDKIIQYSNFFNIDKEKLFEITLQDRIKIYKEKHKKGLENFINGSSDENLRTIFFLREKNGSSEGMFNDLSPCFLKAADYLRNNRLKNNLTMYHMAKRIGVEITQYHYWEKGCRGMTIYAIFGCHKIFGHDPHEILDMVVNEKVDFYSFFYRKRWEEYKTKMEVQNGSVL